MLVLGREAHQCDFTNVSVVGIVNCRPEGGILHVHGNVKDSEVTIWAEHVSKSFSDIAKAEGKNANWAICLLAGFSCSVLVLSKLSLTEKINNRIVSESRHYRVS